MLNFNIRDMQTKSQVEKFIFNLIFFSLPSGMLSYTGMSNTWSIDRPKWSSNRIWLNHMAPFVIHNNYRQLVCICIIWCHRMLKTKALHRTHTLIRDRILKNYILKLWKSNRVKPLKMSLHCHLSGNFKENWLLKYDRLRILKNEPGSSCLYRIPFTVYFVS